MSGTAVVDENIPLARRYRIFLASPGDVHHERSIVGEVVNELRGKSQYRNLLNIQLIAWDQPGLEVSLTAGLTPQEAIKQGLPLPSECDLVICLFWWRIGTLLSEDFIKPTGERYLSGTEWEYLDAMDAYRRKGTPEVLLYRRLPLPRVAPDAPQFDEFTQQWQKLQQFLSSLQNEDGSFATGINEYKGPDDFRPKIRQTLDHYLDKAAEDYRRVTPDHTRLISKAPVSWQGNPYPGASAFSPEQGDVYFGRVREIDQLLERLSDPATRFILVTGVSGCGKSSLLLGGLIPRLRKGYVSSTAWLDVVVRPAQVANDPFQSFVAALHASLSGSLSQQKLENASSIATDESDCPSETITRTLMETVGERHCIVVLDQLEELFTLVDNLLSGQFLKWIKTIILKPNIHVVASMRADFYAQAAAHTAMAELLRDERALFPITLPDERTMREIIERPALAAGITLEEGLADHIIADAGREGGALALTAFALHELYERGHDDSLLSLHDYEKLGGIKGAVSKKVESLLSQHKTYSAESFDQLFTLLVKFNADSMPTRQHVRKEDATDQQLVDTLASARVLLIETSQNTAYMEITHESLFEGWPKLRDWIKDSAQRLEAQRDLEQTAREWQEHNRPISGLRGGQLLARYRTAKQISVLGGDYLRACSIRAWALRGSAAALILLFGLGIAVFVHIQSSDYPGTVATKGLAVKWGLLAIEPPKMVILPVGDFAMGDLGDDCRLPDTPPVESACKLECISGEQEGSCLQNEKPVRIVTFTQPLQLGKYEVTFAEYDLFAAATGRNRPDDEKFMVPGSSRSAYPVINITWQDALDYTQWLSAMTGEAYRLPTESEWEYAARAGTSTTRFWESSNLLVEAACQFANVYDEGHRDAVIARISTVRRWTSFSCADSHVFSAPIASPDYQPNPWQLWHMLGNVAEWVMDCYEPSHLSLSTDGTAYLPEETNHCDRVIRGGNWLSNPISVRAAYRDHQPQSYSAAVIGFRLARTLKAQY